MPSFAQRDIAIEAHVGRTPESENWYYTKREQSYVANEEYANADVGDTARLFLSNPEGSETSAVVTTALGNAAAQSIVRVYDSFDTDPEGTGTPVQIQNNLLDASGEDEVDTGAVNVERDVSVSSPEQFFALVVGGGAGGGSQSGVGNALPFIVEPGRRVLVEVEKLGSGGETALIDLNWFERSVVYSEETFAYRTDEV